MFIMWQLGEALLYSWRYIIQIKQSSNNHISILGELLFARCTPPGAQYRLNHLQPQLSAHYTEKQQGEDCGAPPSKEPEEPRHGCSCSGHSTHINNCNLNIRICTKNAINALKHNSHPTWPKSALSSEKNKYLVDNVKQFLLSKTNPIKFKMSS